MNEEIKEEGSSENENIQNNGDKKRLRWIDQGRGLIMFLLVLTVAFPPREWKREGSIMFFIFGHPDPYANYMTIYDIGAASFIFIIGLVFSISFHKRLEREGLSAALKHVFIRYGLLLSLGLLIIFADSGDFVYYREELPGVAIIIWDVIPTLGLVGFIALPFVFIKNPKIRMMIAYGWMIFYQVLMNTTFLKLYASLSIHGGIFGTIFTYSGIMIAATALGDYMFNSETEEAKKYKFMAIFGLLNLIGGIGIAFIPGWEASKRKMTFSHGAISIGATVIGLLVFAYLDKKKDKEIAFLQAYGRNPFFTYFLAIVPVFLLENTIGDDLGIGWIGNIIVTSIILTYTTITVWILYKNRSEISTEKATLIFIGVAVVLAIILLGLGVL